MPHLRGHGGLVAGEEGAPAPLLERLQPSSLCRHDRGPNTESSPSYRLLRQDVRIGNLTWWAKFFGHAGTGCAHAQVDAVRAGRSWAGSVVLHKKGVLFEAVFYIACIIAGAVLGGGG